MRFVPPDAQARLVSDEFEVACLDKCNLVFFLNSKRPLFQHD
jgi:hypothetical protein